MRRHAPPAAPQGFASLERDAAAFLHSLRASRSDAAAPPNALHVRDAIQALRAHFGSAFDEVYGAAPMRLPALRQLQLAHERVWAFVTCYHHARRIHTLYECHLAFLAQEGVRHFGELGIGNSFVHTDAVQTLYHAPATIYRLTTMDVLTALRQFESVLGHDAFAANSHSHHHHHQSRAPPQRVDREQFKQFIAQQRRQPNAEAMGLHIDVDGFGPYIAMLRRISKKEQREIHELQEEFNKGIADRVFELSKEKFSAENRQQALAELLQRTNEQRATELARGEPVASSAPARRLTAKKATATLSSLSLEILNRVTDVDVYLDNVLRWKSADERFKGRLGAHQIADADQKIRTQLTQFLLASQKSRHHARVKVVTWVLCGILAKIHTLLQLDDKVPDAKPSAEETGKTKAGEDGDKDDDEGEECDCCCVGEETCRCRCQCECHRDDSEDEKTKEISSDPPSTESDVKEEDTQSPAKRKRSRSRSDSIVLSSNDVLAALDKFLSQELGSLNEDIDTTEQSVKLLARAEAHLRAAFGERIKSFSLVEEVVKKMELARNEEKTISGDDALSRVANCLRRSGIREPDAAISSTSATKEEMRDFIADCLHCDTPAASTADLRRAVARLVCIQFTLDQGDEATRKWVDGLVSDVAKDVESGEDQKLVQRSSVLHYAAALSLPIAVKAAADGGSSTSELALLEDEATRDQVVGPKTAEAKAALIACPFLVDVSEWTHWRSRFEAFCGTLRVFLRSHEMIRPDDHAEFVCCNDGRVVKIRGRDEASASALDSAELSPEALALELVSLFVQQRGSPDDFPRELVVLHLRTILKQQTLDGDRAISTQARYVLDTILAVPLDFVAFVYGLLEEAARPMDLESDVVRSCRSQLERRQLYVLGEIIPKPKWKEVSSQVRPVRIVRSELVLEDAPKIHAIASTVLPPTVSKPPPGPSLASPETAVVPADADACESFITKLRREQFGIGLEIADDETRTVLQAQHRRLERALKRLSDELYSEKTHFVLELLQNADDNQYPNGEVPRGEFVLTREGKIIFSNNELGFSESNVQAICDVGASTKEHEIGDKRSIGKKGIGFKSVFKVSDTPEVHSNGFHIRFHAKDEQVGRGLGYILPYWIEDQAQWENAVGTTFVFPLNEHSAQRQDEISASLLSFEPTVLLFLQKIRVLRLTNQVTGGQLVFEKHEVVIGASENKSTTISIATLESKRASDDSESPSIKTSQRWVVVRHQLDIPAAFQQRGSHSEIAIAVPVLDEETQDEVESQRPPLQQVFCYLPLRSYGFRFIIQGDFEVPSSREAISNGSDWNQWLISQYAILLPALVGLVQSGQLSLRGLLRVLPLDSDVQAPFRSLVAEFSREIRQIPCFPSSVGDILCSSGELLDVSDFADDDAVDFLIQEDAMVHTAVGKRIMNVDLASSMPPLLKAQLRVERLRASHVLRLLGVAATKHESVLVLKLLHLLVKISRHDRHRSLLLQELRRIKCFPVRTGQAETWTSVAEVKGTLFIRSRHTTTKAASVFIDDLSVVSDQFTTELDASFPDTRRFLGEQLGVRELNDHDLIAHHVVPALKLTDNNQSKWCHHVKFLSGHLQSCGSSCALRGSIRTAMRVVTWSGRVVHCEDEKNPVFVLFPVDAKRLEATSKWLRGVATQEINIVDLDVLADVEDEAHRALWIDACGLSQLLDPNDKRSSSVLDQIVKWINAEHDISVKRRVSTELARYVDTKWSSPSDTSGEWWQQAPWLEGSDGLFYHPRDLWVASAHVTAVFARSMIPVAKIAFESQDLLSSWQFKTTPSVDDVLHVLKSLSRTTTNTLDFDVSDVTRLYSFLLQESRNENLPKSASTIRKAFASKPLIFLPGSEDGESGNGFVAVDGVVWSSGEGAVASVAVTLDSIYPKALRAFFVGVCGVEKKPTVDQLLMVLRNQLGETEALSKRKWTSRIAPVLRLLSKTLAKGKLSNTQAKSMKKSLKSIPWIPTTSSSSKFKLCSMKRSKASIMAYSASEEDREIQRLCVSLAYDDTEDEQSTQAAVEFVAIEDPTALSDVSQLLRHIGVVSVRESLLSHPGVWCRWLASIGAVATEDVKTQRRARKKYEKVFKKILRTWAIAWGEKEETLSSDEFKNDLSTLSLFPSAAETKLARGVDVFVNDQSDLSQDQLQHPSLHLLGLFSWDHFVGRDLDDASSVLRFLLEAAQVRSLSHHLHTEVVLLGPQQEVADDLLVRQFRLALSVAQRVVFHHHASAYATLDHANLQELLSVVELVEVSGDAQALQLVHRVATTDFAFRHAVPCYLERNSGRVFMASSQDSSSPLLFDLLREVCRQCFGSSIATSVANVLYLASMQPSAEALESWLVDTQNVPPLDARAGTIHWIPSDQDLSIQKPKAKRQRVAMANNEVKNQEDMEDGELEDDEQPAQAKRAKSYAWEQDASASGSWTSSQNAYPHTGGGYHASGSHHPPPSSYGSSNALAPLPSPSLQSLAFNGSSNGLSDEEKVAIGRWGEEYVYLQLKQSYADRPEVVVDWVNEKEESGLPYDIVVKTGSSNDVEYVEVKSTKTMEKGVFEISMNELDQAATHGSRYCIYRVFNAGNAALCRVVRMKNPVALVRQKKIGLVLLMQ